MTGNVTTKRTKLKVVNRMLRTLCSLQSKTIFLLKNIWSSICVQFSQFNENMSTKERKVALMGFRSVGKSSLTIQFVDNQFVDSYDPTIENTFQKTIRINGQDYSLELKDTAGQDEYSILPQSYFMNIDGYVLVYSVNSFKSFEVVKIIYEKLLDMKGSINRVPVVLVGNKSDLTLEREVQYEDGKKLASSWNVPFLETSAKENQSVSEIFSMIMLAILRAEGSDQKKGGCVLS